MGPSSESLGHSHLFKVHLVPAGFTSRFFTVGTKFPPEIFPSGDIIQALANTQQDLEPTQEVDSGMLERFRETERLCVCARRVEPSPQGLARLQRCADRCHNQTPSVAVLLVKNFGSPGLGRCLSGSPIHLYLAATRICVSFPKPLLKPWM